MSKGFRLPKRKAQITPIEKRIAQLTLEYTGTLPGKYGHDQEGLTAKVVCEGSVYVALRLIDEARESANIMLSRSLYESLANARDQLNALDL